MVKSATDDSLHGMQNQAIDDSNRLEYPSRVAMWGRVLQLLGPSGMLATGTIAEALRLQSMMLK
jgi:hypothetical protein